MSRYPTIEQELIDILESARIDGNKIYLTCGQLPRDKYLILDDCLKRLGGKWCRGGYHEFIENPQERIQAVIDTGFMPVNNPYAYHRTPEALCEEIVGQARLGYLDSSSLILEPSAGQGAIVDKIIEANDQVYIHCVELDPINASILKRRYHYKHNVEIINSDFLEYSGYTDENGNDVFYDFIIMNPPFSVEGDKDAYITHVKHAWSLLNSRGILISIVNGGWEIKNQKKYKEFREWLSDKLYKYEFIPENTFESTPISTRIIELRKDNSDSLKEYNGWNSWNSYYFMLHLESERDLQTAWYDMNISIESIEERARNRFNKSDYNMYFPLRKEDLIELQKYRIRNVE